MTFPGGGEVLADVIVRANLDTRGIGPQAEKQLTDATVPAADKAGRESGHHFGKSLISAIGKAGIAAAVGASIAGIAAGKFFLASIKSASDLNETLTKTDQIFGKQSKNLSIWAKNAASDMGQSTKAALDGAATFGIYGKQAKLSGSELFNFSTHLVGLAGDMASFSNTSPEQAIEAIGAAFRGESDPIEKYGVLLNEARLKQVAVREGIIRTTKEALSPQARVLAVQAALYEQLGKKGSGTLGDFERTQGGLANQTRILQANFENMKVTIGTGLLPVAQRFVQQLNTKVMPALEDLWAVHGPAVIAFLTKAGDKFNEFVAKLAAGDFEAEISKVKGFFAAIGPALKDFAEKAGPAGDSIKMNLVPALKELKGSGTQGLADTFNVMGVVFGFLADHIDTVAKALPYLVAGLVAYRVAQLGANIAAGLSPAIRILEIQATRKQTAAIVANTAAKTGETAATVGDSVATAVNTGAKNSGILATIRATAVTVAQRVATLAGIAVTWLATAATTALGAAITFATGPIGIIILVIAALVAGIILLWKKNETFRTIVLAVWAAVKVAIKAVGDWFTGTLWPSLKKAYEALVAGFTWFKNGVVGAWNLFRDGIKLGWLIVKTIFDTVKTYITQTIPNAFKTGVAAIGKFWDGLKQFAKDPVKFVVNTVLNEWIIDNFNKVSGFFHGPHIDRLKTIGDGPGMAGSGGGVRRTGSGPGPAGAMTGDGIGDMLGFLKGPASWVKGKITSKLGQIGDSPFAQTLVGMGKNLADSLLKRLSSIFSAQSGDAGGGSVGVGGLRSGILGVLGALRGVFGNVGVISGFRAGSRTLTGNVSYHASGRAIDIAPHEQWAAYLNATFGRQLRELITPWQQYNVHNGRPHTYTGAVWNQHNFAGGNAHIHAAMDSGGYLQPGLNLVPNWTGAPEPVIPGHQMDALLNKMDRLIGAVTRVAPGVGAEIGNMGASLRLASRTR